MNRLEGKIAVVTGAARGIGAAIVRAFAREGALVLATDIDDAAGRKLAESFAERVGYARLDVREEADWRRVMGRMLDEYGAVNVLVNNAGITGFEAGVAAHDPEHAAIDDWRAVHRTNLDGVFLGCKHAIAAMRTCGARGSIVNVCSRSGLVGIPGAAAYASSKAAVRNHTRSVALYCAGEGLDIRCNAVNPAAILTPMWEPLLGQDPGREARMREFVADCPLGRFGTPDEVAAICVMLASDESAYMTGAEINIDGGTLAGAAVAPSTGR